MPFPHYDVDDIAAFAAEDEWRAAMERQREQKQEAEATPVANQVAALERSLFKCRALCVEIVTTLTIEGNAHWFRDLPEGWEHLVTAWKKRLEALS
jgi:hypothetical protein